MNFTSRSKSGRGQRKKDRQVRYKTNRQLPAKMRRERQEARRKEVRDRIQFFAEAVVACNGAARTLLQQSTNAVLAIANAKPVTPWTPVGEAAVKKNLDAARVANSKVDDLAEDVTTCVTTTAELAKKALVAERMADLNTLLGQAEAVCDSVQLANQEALVTTGYAVEASRAVADMVQGVADLHAQHKMEEANAEAELAEEPPPV